MTVLSSSLECKISFHDRFFTPQYYFHDSFLILNHYHHLLRFWHCNMKPHPLPQASPKVCKFTLIIFSSNCPSLPITLFSSGSMFSGVFKAYSHIHLSSRNKTHSSAFLIISSFSFHWPQLTSATQLSCQLVREWLLKKLRPQHFTQNISEQQIIQVYNNF